MSCFISPWERQSVGSKTLNINCPASYQIEINSLQGIKYQWLSDLLYITSTKTFISYWDKQSAVHNIPMIKWPTLDYLSKNSLWGVRYQWITRWPASYYLEMDRVYGEQTPLTKCHAMHHLEMDIVCGKLSVYDKLFSFISPWERHTSLWKVKTSTTKCPALHCLQVHAPAAN